MLLKSSTVGGLAGDRDRTATGPILAGKIMQPLDGPPQPLADIAQAHPDVQPHGTTLMVPLGMVLDKRQS
jgi:hypothetical protein